MAKNEFLRQTLILCDFDGHFLVIHLLDGSRTDRVETLVVESLVVEAAGLLSLFCSHLSSRPPHDLFQS